MSWFHNFQADSSPLSSPSPSTAKTSPAIVFLIIIVAIVFMLCGLLHLLIRFIMVHRPSFLNNSQSNQNPEISIESDIFQRQLHQLFELHDSGLDQSLIDALPVFQYKEIMGLKEPFDCPVCLCEFFEEDKLRLIPQCSHAFHVDCIDTWLLSNSTCPLCRRALCSPGLVVENPVLESDNSREEAEITATDVVFPVRLGKFRSTNNEKGEGVSSSDLGARRCYSMGSSYEYVLADSLLQVAFSSKGRLGQSQAGDSYGKRISAASKNESYSVSKIWLWSKKGKFLGSSNTHLGDSVDRDLPWTTVV